MRSRAEVVVVGAGWAGSIITAELAAAGHHVTVLERGTWPAGAGPAGFVTDDDGRWPSRQLTEDARLETYTMRHRSGQASLPIRRLNSFWAGSTVGGAGAMWSGFSPRFVPDSFRSRSAHVEAFGPSILRPDVRLVDWPLTYADLEPDYTRFEQVAGVSGASGADPFAGPRSAPYPVEVAPDSVDAGPWVAAARRHGLHPYPRPVAGAGVETVNHYGLTRAVDPVRGRSLATPLNSVLPYALGTGRVDLVEGARVRRVLHDGRRATGVRYVDADGEHDLEAEVVVLAAWALGNTRLLLMSDVGRPYDPETEQGTVGRNHANHVGAVSTAWFDRSRHDSSAWRTGAWSMSDLAALPEAGRPDYVGGAHLVAGSVGPSDLSTDPRIPVGSPRWGAGLRTAIDRYEDAGVQVGLLGEVVPHRRRHLDLDPTFRDPWGDPLLRITFDWDENERSMVRSVARRVSAVLRDTGADLVDEGGVLPDHYDVGPYQNSHATGGAVMGTDPATSVVDPDLRSWDIDRLWVVGASAFPTAASPNPTPTVGALSFRASRSIRRHLEDTEATDPPSDTPHRRTPRRP